MNTNFPKCLVVSMFIVLSIGRLSAQGNAVSGKIQTDNALKSKIDRAVHTYAIKYLSAPNTFILSIGIYDNGMSYQYNYAKRDNTLPNGNTFYGIGSIAKTFVGWMLSNAVIEHKVKLEDDIRSYFPGSYPNLSFDNHPVRVQHLANHTSALPELSRFYADEYLDSISKLPPQQLRSFYNSYNSDSLLSDMHYFTVDTIPGTKYRYNGNAMMVLIALLQEVYQQQYPELITNYLQDKYHMLNTKPALSETQELTLPAGHDGQGNKLPLVVDKGFRGAPTMFSTPNDMLLYMKANLDPHDAATSLSHRFTFSTSSTAQIGLSWMLGKETDGSRYIMHTGRDGFGFSALCFMYPDLKMGIALFVNETASEENLDTLKNEIRTALSRMRK